MSGNRSGLLSYVTSVQVAGTKKFIAAGAFGAQNPAGIKFWLSGNFEKHFLGKVEEDIEAATIIVVQLEESSRDPGIMAELGAEKRVIKLAQFYEMLKTQANGQEGPLLINGYANIAYIEDENGNFWPVDAHWHSFPREWHVRAHSVVPPYVWPTGSLVLSRK